MSVSVMSFKMCRLKKKYPFHFNMFVEGETCYPCSYLFDKCSQPQVNRPDLVLKSAVSLQ